MLTIQTAIISLALFSVIVLNYSQASGEIIKTKQTTLKTFKKQFFEKNLKNLVSDVLNAQGSCSEKKKTAALQLKKLSELLEKKGVGMKVGFVKNFQCNCKKPNELIQLNGKIILASEEILTCIGEKLAISKINAKGLPAIIFSQKEAEILIIQSGSE